MAATDLGSLRGRARDALNQLAGVTPENLAEAKGLVEELRNAREYERMGQLAEAVSRQDPDDPKNRRLYAQYLIDTGHATVAVDVLRLLARRLPAAHPERIEATGLLGRAYKQIFFDAGDKSTASSRRALKAAIAAYRAPHAGNPANT
jgi:cytochrome c-type biogenesis protein CcmH/NrfG